jgi:cell division septum initiation protein DivIVA/DNA-binding XRE family transcriptional regulator
MSDSIADEPAAPGPADSPPLAGGASSPGSKLLGAELAHTRREAALTQRELADRLGVRLWMIDQWEAGAKAIPHAMLEQIATAIGTPGAERLAGRDIDYGHRPGALTLLGSSDTMAESPSRPLSAQEIRNAELPRSLRGFDETATRRLLDNVATAYERSVSQCDELRQQVDGLEAVRIDPEEHTLLVMERDELRERLQQMAEATKSSADLDGIVAERDSLLAERDSLRAERNAAVEERDELRKRADQLTAEIAELERAATATGERSGVRERVEELEQKLAGYVESEQALTRALVAASRAGEELVKEAEAEAEAIVSEARRSAKEIERELEDRRGSFDSERATIVEELRREALASSQDDIDALERATKPVLEALAVLQERIRAIVPSGAEDTADAELLEDLKAPPAKKTAATVEADRD